MIGWQVTNVGPNKVYPQKTVLTARFSVILKTVGLSRLQLEWLKTYGDRNGTDVFTIDGLDYIKLWNGKKKKWYNMLVPGNKELKRNIDYLSQVPGEHHFFSEEYIFRNKMFGLIK